MLGFATLITAGTALLFGLLPALQAVRVSLNLAMNEGGRLPGAERRSWVSRAVVSAQVAVCLVLVTGSVLFARSLANVSKANLGFDRDSLLLVDVNPTKVGIRGEQNDLFYKRLLNELNDTPGIISASCSRVTPLGEAQWWDPAVVPGYLPARDETTTVYLNQVSPGYFRTMGIRLVEGREFTAKDDKQARRVAIVNQSFARRFFQGQTAVGRVFSTGTGASAPENERYAIFRDLVIVGIAADTKYNDPHETQKDEVYLASYQAGLFDITGAVEVRLAPGVKADQAATQIRALVRRLANGMDVEIRPYDALLDRRLQRDRMVAALSGLFGLAGVVLACIGLYGTMSHAVTSRTGEIGIRMTLGARHGQVEWMILRETLLMMAIGAAAGVPLAIASGRMIGDLLYGLRPADPSALLLSLGLMAAVSVASAWLPARRAARIDPVRALRHE